MPYVSVGGIDIFFERSDGDSLPLIFYSRGRRIESALGKAIIRFAKSINYDCCGFAWAWQFRRKFAFRHPSHG